MTVKNYTELIVWQKAMDLTVMVYKITKILPKEEIYSLTNQMRRAAVSVPSNIAEGQARNSTKEFIHFLGIAQGSIAELETQLLVCNKIGYLSDSDIMDPMSLAKETVKMLNGLISKLSTAH